MQDLRIENAKMNKRITLASRTPTQAQRNLISRSAKEIADRARLIPEWRERIAFTDSRMHAPRR